MLTSSFAHVPGVGEDSERALWNGGFATWDDILDSALPPNAGQVDAAELVKELRKSKKALSELNHQYFMRKLKLKGAWRAWPEFKDSCAYLDIETDGGKSGDSITMIGVWDGKEFHALTRGHDLDMFRDLISRYSMIVTFFGASFDVPMLQKRFPDIRFDQLHWDLCPSLRTVGLRGGLKSIEKQLGINRGETDGLTGFDAIKLWNRYKRFGDSEALDLLVEYNRQDVVNLETICHVGYDKLKTALYSAAS